MNELEAILDGIERLWLAGEEAALATVVSVKGSAYRRPGAQMLISPGGGGRIGSVSGGCLEGDVARKAWQLTEGGQAAVLRYDSSADDDGLWGLWLGCNGVIEILVERIARANPLVGFVRQCFERRRRGLVATVFGGEEATGVAVGARLLMDEDGAIESDPSSLAERIPRLVEHARATAELGETQIASYKLANGRAEALLEIIEPPVALVICGAGWDALPLVAAARAVGWRVAVADRRAGHATRERFPLADGVVVCPPADLAKHVRMDARTAIVLMTHHYPDDLGFLPAALRSEAFYVGLLGPARRRDRLLVDLFDQEGFAPADSELARLYGPVGLDIGAEEPAEVAAAIVAEILGVLARRSGGPMRERCAPIHDQVRHLKENACSPPQASVA